MTDPNQPLRQRLRITFAKRPEIKYISHLDLVLVWERAFRRAQLPLAYSQGFNPRPKIQVAAGLPVGTTGSAEILDVIITEQVDPAELLERIRTTLPRGVAIHFAAEVPLKTASLQHLLRQAEYRVIVETNLPAQELTSRIQALLAANQVIQTRRRRQLEEKFDLRPWLHDLRLESVADNQARLFMRLTAGQFGNLRPEEVLKALDLADNWTEIERTRLIFEDAPFPDSSS
jgi:radical SAM-linked protein